MFSQPSIDDYYRNKLNDLRGEILRESNEQIIGTPPESMADYYADKNRLELIELDESQEASWESNKSVRRVRSQEREDMYRGDGDIDWPCEEIIISVPIKENHSTDYFNQLRTSTITLDGLERQIKFTPTKIITSFVAKDYGVSKTEDQIAQEINRRVDRIHKMIMERNLEIAQGNSKLRESALGLIIERKGIIEADKSVMSAIASKVKIPLKIKQDLPSTKILVSTRPLIHKIKPTPKLPEEYVLDPQKVKEILEYLDSQARNFEKTPNAISKLEEEEIRDLILSMLNSIFEESATGETFSKKGKTDIYLSISKGNILVFECKIWGGAKLYVETIDQLSGYLTWRHNFGVVISFVKNKDFSKVLKEAATAIQLHKYYTGAFKELLNTHLVSRHKLPEDSEKEVEIHHLFYNLYVAK
jgi:hypothetical protein